MKHALIVVASLLALASCSQEQPTTTTAALPSASLVGAKAKLPPAVEQAEAFADSMATQPQAVPADVEAARAYVRAVTQWQESKLKPSIKDHPCMENTWARYRYVLRAVAKARTLPKVKPEDQQTWDSFTPQCEAVTKLLLPLIDEPDLSPTQAVGSLINVESGMGNVKFAVERHLRYLEAPTTRDL